MKKGSWVIPMKQGGHSNETRESGPSPVKQGGHYEDPGTPDYSLCKLQLVVCNICNYYFNC